MKILVSLLLVMTSMAVQAATYKMPERGDYLVGAIRYVEMGADNTLLDIAREYDLGFNEIAAANPDIDPWVPGEGTRVVVPTMFILPKPPWRGIVINLAEMRLYYFPKAEPGRPRQVMTFPIGIGRQGWATPVGRYNILMKIENPSWSMPESVYQEHLAEGRAPQSRTIPPGPDNPLGKFAMQLNNTGLFIHGTNKPFSVGMRVSHGCLRLYPEDITRLVDAVPKGTSVRIVEQPYKFGLENGVLYMEAHKPVEIKGHVNSINLGPALSRKVKRALLNLSQPELRQMKALAAEHTGVPVRIQRPTSISLSSRR